MRINPHGIRALALVAIGLVLVAGCAPSRRSEPTLTLASEPSTRSALPQGPEPASGPERATVALDGARRNHLGLPPLGSAVDVGALEPLTPAQWADPEAVAARVAVLQTNYRAEENPADVEQRWRPYLSAPLAAELAGPPGGAAGLAQLRADNAVFAGEVLGVHVEQTDERAVVSLTVRHSVVSSGRAAQPARVAFWTLTLVADPTRQRWFVVTIERS